MSIGSGIAIAGAFIGTGLAFMFAPGLDPFVFAAPAAAAAFIAI